MLTCKGCVGKEGCNREKNHRCNSYSRKNKVTVVHEDLETPEQQSEIKSVIHFGEGNKCKRQCADHCNYWCPKDDITICVGMCRGRIEKGRCSGCDRFDRITAKFKEAA